MTEYDNRGRGVLFPNKDKKSDKHPDYKGSVNIEGTEYDLAGWKKVSKKGAQFLSMTAKPKGERPVEKAKDFDDSIPF